MKRVAFILATALVVCGVMNVSASHPSANTGEWKTYNIEVGNQIVSFMAPLGESADYPEFTVPKHVVIDRQGVFNSVNSGPDLLIRHWDYRKNRFETIYGTLSANIHLYRSSIVIRNTDDLLAAVKQNDRLDIERRTVDLGRPVFADSIVRADIVKVADRNALLVDYKVTRGIYYVPLDANHYLSISIDASGVTQPGWHEDAQAAADAMLRSIRIELRQ